MIRAASRSLFGLEFVDWDAQVREHLPADDDCRVPNVVVVDPRFDAYASLAASARAGRIGLHLRSSGGEALRLAQRLPVDAWLIASDLEDMSGHDLVALLEPSREQSDGSVAKVAVIESAEPGGRRWAQAQSEAVAAGADSVMSDPITLADLEDLLDLPLEERSRVLATRTGGRPFATVPIGVGAAVVALAVLFMG
jgi:CheY-like chemotaxis protein